MAPTLDVATGEWSEEWEAIADVARDGEIETRKVAAWLGY